MKWISVKERLPKKNKKILVIDIADKKEWGYGYYKDKTIEHRRPKRPVFNSEEEKIAWENKYPLRTYEPIFEKQDGCCCNETSVTHWAEIEPPKDEE